MVKNVVIIDLGNFSNKMSASQPT